MGVSRSKVRKDIAMKFAALLVPLGVVFALPAVASAEPAPAPAATATHKDASIPFANYGGVDDWRATDSKTVYLRDQHRQWYRATLIVPAIDLPYVEHIGIDAGPTGSLDKFGAIIVKGQRYQIGSFERVDGPPKKGEKQAHRIDPPKKAAQHK
jgi:hypothetical protein